ncbi:hypothetical protein Poly24_21550 [Rosistilla carotiformis]|uniref:DUF6798 domain-containing protein n=1 Tax=Rosistilla carotiformis TaxID=2528017 RepID=A0A518JSC9_9BACT|nr:DUF6798 domain-containing protein [Rosistilla carotiformis]QDV68446.1 hypothetical protein Poly24_21550 [Rosistilla carotiformis]
MEPVISTTATDPPTGAHVAPRLSMTRQLWEVSLLMLLFFVHAGDPPPGINEAHYLTKAKNYWDPTWCAGDMFVTSGKAHVVFYLTIGWLTKFTSLSATAWIGRILGWAMIAWALQRLSWAIAPLRYASLLVGLVWIVGVEQADLAGEWVIGGIEAKVFAYGFVLLAMESMVRQRWWAVWPLLGAASAFHVLVGGWSVVAAMIALLATTREWTLAEVKRQAIPLVIGGAIAMFGVAPGMATMQGVDPADARQAASIYTYQRISHHLYPASFAPRRYIGHLLLIAVTVGLAWPLRRRESLRPVLWFTVGAVSIAAMGMLVAMLPAVAPDLAASLLRYYWFRLTDAIVPLTTGLCLAASLTATQVSRSAGLRVGFAATVCVLVFSSMFLVRQRAVMPDACRQSLISFDVNRPPEYQLRVYSDWRQVCDWVRDNTPPEAVFLSPRHQQTFKWFAQRAEVVNWKDVPQDAPSLIEWKRRMAEIFPRRLGGVRVTIRYDQLRQFREEYKTEYLIVDRRISPGNLPLVMIYPTGNEQNETYRVYRLPELDGS